MVCYPETNNLIWPDSFLGYGAIISALGAYHLKSIGNALHRKLFRALDGMLAVYLE